MSDAVLTADLPPDRAGRPDWAAALLPFDGYRRGIEDAGLEVVAADLMPPAVWDEYYAPMRGLLEELRRYRRDPDALAWADENEAMIRQEQALLPVMAYAHFAARRPE